MMQMPGLLPHTSAILYTIFVLFLLLPPVVSVASLGPLPAPLTQWLASQVIHLPQQATAINEQGLSMSDFNCSGITIGGVDSSYLGTDPVLNAEVFNVSLQCVGSLAYSSGRFRTQGMVTAAIGGTTLSTELRAVLDGNPPLITGMTVDKCSFAIGYVDIHFSGGLRVPKFLEDIIGKALQNSVPSVACTVLRQVVERNVSQALAHLSDELRPFLRPLPPPTEPHMGSGFVPWSKSVAISAVDTLLENVLGSDPPSKLQDIIHRLAGNSSVLALHGLSWLKIHRSLPGLGTVEVTFPAIEISGLDHITYAKLVQPKASHSLMQHLTWQQLTLNVTGDITLTSSTDTIGLKEKIVFTVNLDTMDIQSAVLLAVSETAVTHLTLDQLLKPRCTLDAISNVTFWSTNTNTDFGYIAVEAQEGSLEQELSDVLNNVFRLTLDCLRPSLPLLMNGLVAGSGQQWLNDHVETLKKFILPVAGECPAMPPPEVHVSHVRHTGEWVVWTFTVATFLALGFAALREWGAGKESGEQEDCILHYEVMVSQTERASLLYHPRLPWYVRYGLPVLVCCCLGMCITANTRIAGTVFSTVTSGGETLRLPDVKSFDIGGVVHDMWQAGVWILSLLIAYAGGLWGYVKCLGMLFCWVVPRRMVALKTCERILMGMDLIGKLSLANCWVMAILQVANRFHADTTSTANESASFDIYLDPQEALFMYLMYTYVSQALGYCMLASLRHTMGSADPNLVHDSPPVPYRDLSDDSQEHPPEAMGQCVGREHGSLTQSVISLCLIMMLLVSSASVVVSCFDTHVTGAAGLIAKADRSFGLWDFMKFLPDTNSHPSSAGILSIQAIFLVVCIVIPVLLLALTTALWLFPFSPRTQHRLYMVVETLNAWSGLESFAISYLLLSLEIHTFAQFILGDKCNVINKLLKRYLDKQLHGHDFCFDAELHITYLGYVLFASSLLMVMVMSTVIMMSHSVMQKRRSGWQALPTDPNDPKLQTHI